jgi:hypothetical protein
MGVAALLAIALYASPGVIAQTPSDAVQKGDQMKKGDQQVTVSGCVQREADYRREQDKGRGGVAGTGVGAGDEYVLTNISGSGATSGGTATAYELTGENEKLAKAHVGHRVEITGMLKAAEVSASGKPTGGATAGSPPSGVDLASKDLQLRELEVTAVKMISADCSK